MNQTEWGRRESIMNPPRAPLYVYSAILISAVSIIAAGFLWIEISWTRLERFYLTVYFESGVLGVLEKSHTYVLPLVIDAKGRYRPAIPSDVEPGQSPQRLGPPLPFKLTAKGKTEGLVEIERGDSTSYSNKALHEYLGRFVYGNNQPLHLIETSAAVALLCLAAQLPFAIPRDMKRLRERKYGRYLKGPRLLSADEFNRELKGDGVGFQATGSRALLRIPRRVEGQHIEIMGDTGSGKTRLIMMLLTQIRDRRESAIVYDPACEFVQRFYQPLRGDIILNPLDARCPYWGPSEELRSRAEAKAIAASLYQPTTDRRGEFFVETPQKIFAHLLTFGPTPEELVAWMADPEQIDLRVQGTEMANMVAKGAQQQRNGVLASLGLIADSLRLLPPKSPENRSWGATDWAEDRKGWIFITSKPSEREALRPLHSLWIDLLVLRLLNEPRKNQMPVWFVLDELASLQRLPQLHTAITENRKSKNPLVLGFQGKAQLEVIYGHLAEVMLSQPATKIFLKTSEPKAADWVSSAIGKVEIERVRETYFDGTRRGHNYSIDRQVEPLVLDSEISGLADRHAFLKLGNNVARFSFDFNDIPIVEAALVPRMCEKDDLDFDPRTLVKVVAQRTPPTAAHSGPQKVKSISQSTLSMGE